MARRLLTFSPPKSPNKVDDSGTKRPFLIGVAGGTASGKVSERTGSSEPRHSEYFYLHVDYGVQEDGGAAEPAPTQDPRSQPGQFLQESNGGGEPESERRKLQL